MAKATPEWAKKKLDKLEKGGTDYLQLNDGANYARILPSWRGAGEPFYKEMAYHYRVGPNQETVPCSRLAGKKCWLCAEVDRLKKTGDKDAANELRAKGRFFMNAIDLKDVKGGVKTMAVGSTILKALLKYYVDLDEEWGDWTEEGNRYDFKIEKSGKNLDTEYTVFPTRKFAAIETEGEPQDLDGLSSEYKTSAQMKALYEGTEEPAAEEEEEAEEPAEEEAEEPAAAEEEEAEEPAEEEEEEAAEPAEEEEEEAAEPAEEEEAEAEEPAEEEEAEAEEPAEEEAAEPAEEEEAAEGTEEPPACFEDPAEHNPSDAICKDCDWRKECGDSVKKKIAKEPKKYKDAPLVKLGLLKSDSTAEKAKKGVSAPPAKAPAAKGKPAAVTAKKVVAELKAAVKKPAGKPVLPAKKVFKKK